MPGLTLNKGGRAEPRSEVAAIAAGERSGSRARKGVGGRVSTPARSATYVKPSHETAGCSLQLLPGTGLMASYNNVAAKLPRYYLTVEQVSDMQRLRRWVGAEAA